MILSTKEQQRIDENYNQQKDWLQWGPYLSERQWGTVREDYSPNGAAWEYFPHDHSRSRAYRWGEDGIAGIADKYSNQCFGIALWNGKDAILKERLFGLTGHEGNHGEDVKELYYYLENTPSHSYMKHLYKYPQNAYPYDELVAKNKARNRNELEYEIEDTGVFGNNEYFDVFTEYAKNDTDDILIKITVFNRASKAATISVLPTMWFRNLWSFKENFPKPIIEKKVKNGQEFVTTNHKYLGERFLYFDKADKLLFTENETNRKTVFKDANDHEFKKDLFHHAVTNKDFSVATKKTEGTKFSPMYERTIEGGDSFVIKLRLSSQELENPLNEEFDAVFESRIEECNDFYKHVVRDCTDEQVKIQQQAFAGMLWSKQYYNFDVETWLKGDLRVSSPPVERLKGRNSNWKSLRNHDIMLMPDKWEYPWYAAWDSAFHCVTLALIDPAFAKKQMLLFTKEWYMAPNGQIPAYEWSFSDVNPPVQAWASLKIFHAEAKRKGKKDVKFLKQMFNKLSINFTWWVNRLDSRENNVFEGGFLGLDNIGVFDRSNDIPGKGVLEQVDGTAWMALYCLNMLEMSLQIAKEDDSYEDMAVKYFGHFVFIAEALNNIDIEYEGSWDEKEGFFYDKLIFPNGDFTQIKIRSVVGMLSLAPVLRIKKETLEELPNFKKSVLWFKRHRMENLKYPVIQTYKDGDDLLFSLVPKHRMEILIKVMLDEKEFLSDYGIRSLSKKHEKPYSIDIHGVNYSISYEPGESSTSLFGGNSNWRGPVWFPLNYMFIQALKEYYSYYGDQIKVAFPTGSEQILDLKQVSVELSKRLISIFEKNEKGERPVNLLSKKFYEDEHFKDLILFYEYFHGDNGRGLGASHQTGWTSLVANLISEVND